MSDFPNPSTVGPVFEHENVRFAALKDTLGKADNVPSHHVLSDGIWLSADPDQGVKMDVDAGEAGIRLHLHDIGRARWLSLSFDINAGGLSRARHLGLMITTQSPGFLSYRPCLRYLGRDAFHDQFTDEYVLSSGGVRTQLSHIPVDADRLKGCKGTEVHLFFQGQEFEAEFIGLEAFALI